MRESAATSPLPSCFGEIGPPGTIRGALARCGEHAAAAREYRAAAQTLPEASPQDLVDLLDGCDVAELVSLCQRLAAENDLRATGTAS